MQNTEIDWKKLLKIMKLRNIKQAAPGFFEASGGYAMSIKPYSDTSANGLTKAIEDFVIFSGGYANRISTTGTMRKINGQMKWTNGNSNKGAADIRILYKGVSVDVEIKIGRDRLCDAQIREAEKVRQAGGTYLVVKSFPEFLTWWQDQGFELQELF